MIAEKISERNRTKKYALFLKMIRPSKEDRILDVGFSNKECIPAENFLEKHYPYPSNITALGIDDDDLFRKRYPEVKTVRYDGRTFPFPDKSFAIGWSNAVIEHVGDQKAQILFIQELNRVCRQVYFTTPNRWFPFELHTRLPFLHWLPKRMFDKLMMRWGKEWITGDKLHLLTYLKLRRLCRKAGMTNYRIHRNRFCGFTMDFSVIKEADQDEAFSD